MEKVIDELSTNDIIIGGKNPKIFKIRRLIRTYIYIYKYIYSLKLVRDQLAIKQSQVGKVPKCKSSNAVISVISAN